MGHEEFADLADVVHITRSDGFACHFEDYGKHITSACKPWNERKEIPPSAFASVVETAHGDGQERNQYGQGP